MSWQVTGRFVAGMMVALSGLLEAADSASAIKLPAPDTTGGIPLMQAFLKRASSRSFANKLLPDTVLANLVWAATGVNRPGSGKRTAPSAVNWQEIDVYVARADGLFRYDAKDHVLLPVVAEDVRRHAGVQAFVAHAPVVLIYVANYARMKGAQTSDRKFYAATDTGFISQNVYLFCASEGLATVVLGMIDKPTLHAVMKLAEDQEVVLTQPVGYPADETMQNE